MNAWGVVSDGRVTTAVAAEVFARLEKPCMLPVTVKVIVLPTSAGVSAYSRPVAPGIAAPERFHW